MRVLLVDDHPLFRQALATTIDKLGSGFTVEQFASIASVREAIGEDRQGALILLDLKLPDNAGMTGLLALKGSFADIPVAVISARDDPETVQNVMSCGALGFISKAVDPAVLAEALKTLLNGEAWFPESATTDSVRSLTLVQARIFDGIQRGLMNKQIAFEVGISEHTVKYHVTGIFRHFGCQTRSQLLALTSER